MKQLKKEHNPRAVTLVCDTTFYGKRKDKLATIVFYDTIEINAVAIDGERGLNTVFKGYPIQMCHFHQRKIVDRYITKNPKLEASIELQKILTRLTKNNRGQI